MKKTIDLAAIEARAEAAKKASAPGPWGVWSSQPDLIVQTADGRTIAEFDARGAGSFDTAKFLAHAYEDIPDLIARVRELEATVRNLLSSTEDRGYLVTTPEAGRHVATCTEEEAYAYRASGYKVEKIGPDAQEIAREQPVSDGAPVAAGPRREEPRIEAPLEMPDRETLGRMVHNATIHSGLVDGPGDLSLWSKLHRGLREEYCRIGEILFRAGMDHVLRGAQKIREGR